jgi:hypothetical protein
LTAVVDEALCSDSTSATTSAWACSAASYGGYMTSWIVSHTDRFRAACSERAVNNFVLEGGSSDNSHATKSFVGAALV